MSQKSETEDLNSWVELTLTFSPNDIDAIRRAVHWTDVDETGILAHIVSLAQDKQENKGGTGVLARILREAKPIVEE